MLTFRVLNNENSPDEAFTAIIKMFGSHMQVGIVQTGQRVTRCLWAKIGEKPLNIIASWRNGTSYMELPFYKLNGLYVPITRPNEIVGRTFTIIARFVCFSSVRYDVFAKSCSHAQNCLLHRQIHILTFVDNYYWVVFGHDLSLWS